MRLTDEELEIIDLALQTDIMDQQKFLEKHGNDKHLEEHLRRTMFLHGKIIKYLVEVQPL